MTWYYTLEEQQPQSHHCKNLKIRAVPTCPSISLHILYGEKLGKL